MPLGISVTRIPIPFKGKGGINWSNFWATLISATVENAAPTHVVLTFPDAASTLATDITCTVNGTARAVSSASWTGAVWTVVLASAVVVGDVVVMTFVKSGGTTAVVNNITFEDTFDRADGALANGWTYVGTWEVSTNKAVATPAVTGANMLTNGDFETGDPPTGWTALADNSIAQDEDARPGTAGSYSALVTIGGGAFGARRTINGYTAGRLYRANLWGKRGTNTQYGVAIADSHYFDDEAWAEKTIGYLATATLAYFQLLGSTGTFFEDDITVQQLNTSHLFATRDFGVSDIDLTVDVVRTGNEYGGIVLCVDSTATPTDYILIGIDRYSISAAAPIYTIRVIKVVGGTYGALINIGTTDGDCELRVKKNGTAIRVYVDGVQFSDDIIVTDAGLISNTIHGLFSTGPSVNFNDFTALSYQGGIITGSPVFTRVSQTDLYSTSGAHDWLGWPWMGETANGIWMMTYRAATGHNGTDATARIHIRFSNDEGANWTAEDTYIGGGAVTGWPMAGHEGVSSVGAAMLITCPNGDILAHVYEFYLGTYQWRSEDNGATWTDEGLINSDAKIISIDDFVINGNDIYISVNYTDNSPEPWINRIYKSSDNGATWTLQGQYDEDADEAGLIIAPNGNMIVIMRDDDVAKTYKYVSTDLGVTWGAKTEVPELDILQRPKMRLDGTGGIILHGRQYDTSAPYTVIYYSDDNGETWGRKFYPDVSAAADGHYNDYLIKTDGSYYMISYKGTTSAAKIRQLIFTKA